MDRSISPPPSKRRRFSEGEQGQHGARDSLISIYSWNINGIAPFLQQNKITAYFPVEKTSDLHEPPEHSLRDFLRRHQWPTVLFLQEVKINRNDSTSMRAVDQAVRKRPSDPADAYDYEAHFCLPTDRYNARSFGGRVYGVCSIVRTDFKDEFVTRIRPVEWDLEGRCLIVETRATASLPKLALINIYAVNGTVHQYKDSTTGEIVGTRHDRKLEVHRLLQEECRSLEADGFGVVIAGDLNVARTFLDGFPNLRTFSKQHCLNRADFESKFFTTASETNQSDDDQSSGGRTVAYGLDMIDTFRHLHPVERRYTYYPRSASYWGESCDRVDMILISRSLGRHLLAAGMHDTLADRGPSDHVPLYACLVFPESSTEPDDKAPLIKDP